MLRIDPSLTITTVAAGLCLPNGAAVDLHRDRAYLVDSHQRHIYCARRLADRWQLEPFINTADQPGVPDGLTLDTDGNL